MTCIVVDVFLYCLFHWHTIKEKKSKSSNCLTLSDIEIRNEAKRITYTFFYSFYNMMTCIRGALNCQLDLYVSLNWLLIYLCAILVVVAVIVVFVCIQIYFVASKISLKALTSTHKWTRQQKMRITVLISHTLKTYAPHYTLFITKCQAKRWTTEFLVYQMSQCKQAQLCIGFMLLQNILIIHIFWSKSA